MSERGRQMDQKYFNKHDRDIGRTNRGQQRITPSSPHLLQPISHSNALNIGKSDSLQNPDKINSLSQRCSKNPHKHKIQRDLIRNHTFSQRSKILQNKKVQGGQMNGHFVNILFPIFGNKYKLLTLFCGVIRLIGIILSIFTHFICSNILNHFVKKFVI